MEPEEEERRSVNGEAGGVKVRWECCLHGAVQLITRKEVSVSAAGFCFCFFVFCCCCFSSLHRVYFSKRRSPALSPLINIIT